MSALRFRVRHVHRTVASYIESQMAELGWVDTPANFGTQPLTFLEFQPEEAGKQVAPNTVAITLGDEGPALDSELGDGLREVAYPLFVDVYGASQAMTQSICSDLRDVLSDAYLQVRDFTIDSDGVEVDEQIELDKDDITVERPNATAVSSDFRRHWRVVKTTVRVHHIG